MVVANDRREGAHHHAVAEVEGAVRLQHAEHRVVVARGVVVVAHLMPEERRAEQRKEALGHPFGAAGARAEVAREVIDGRDAVGAARGFEEPLVRDVGVEEARELDARELDLRVTQERERGVDLLRGHVVAEHRREPRGRGPRRGIADGVGLDGREGRVGRGARVRGAFEDREALTRGHTRCCFDEESTDASAYGGVNGELHLHHFEREEAVALGHHVALADEERGDRRGDGGHDASVGGAFEAVRDAVDLDVKRRGREHLHHGEAVPSQREHGGVGARHLVGHVDGVGAARDAIAIGSRGEHLERDRRAAHGEAKGPRLGLRNGRGQSAVRVTEELGHLVGARALVLSDGRCDEGAVEVLARAGTWPRGEVLIEPPRRHARSEKGFVRRELEEERAVRCAALDGDGAAREGLFETREGLFAGGSRGDDLGEHRVELAGDDVARDEARVDANARSRSQFESQEATRARAEPLVGILGVEARLDGVPARRRERHGERLAARDVDLEAHHVDAGHALGDGMLDLEPRVHLEEVEAREVGEHEELRRPRVHVAARARHGDGRVFQLLFEGAEARRGGLFEHLLVAPLHAAIARADGVNAAVRVGDHLHLDVARLGGEGLDQQRRVTEGRARFIGRAREGRSFALGGFAHDADAAPAAARRGLEEHRESDASRVRFGVLRVDHGAAAPRRDGDAVLLGHSLAADLVAEEAHRRARGADEHEPHRGARVCEVGPLRGESPPGPHGVAARFDEQSQHARRVEVGASKRAVGPRGHRVAEEHGLVGLADEERVAVGQGVERDDVEGLAAAPRPRAGRAEKSHGGLAAVDDAHATKGSMDQRH